MILCDSCFCAPPKRSRPHLREARQTHDLREGRGCLRLRHEHHGGGASMSDLPLAQQFLNCEADVLCDLTEQWRSNVATFVEGNRGAASICMAILNVRTALPHSDKAQPLQKAANLSGFQDGNRSHAQATAKFCVPTNSASNWGSPSSNNIATTSRKLTFNSSSDSACECAPGNPGTYPTSSPVTESRSTMAVKFFIAV